MPPKTVIKTVAPAPAPAVVAPVVVAPVVPVAPAVVEEKTPKTPKDVKPDEYGHFLAHSSIRNSLNESITAAQPIVISNLQSQLSTMSQTNNLYYDVIRQHERSVKPIHVAKEIDQILTRLHENIMKDIIKCTLNHLPIDTSHANVEHIFNGHQNEYPYIKFVQSLPSFRYDREHEAEIARRTRDEKHASDELAAQRKAIRERVKLENPTLSEEDLKKKGADEITRLMPKQSKPRQHSQHSHLQNLYKHLVKSGVVPDGSYTVSDRFYVFLDEVIDASIARIAQFGVWSCVIHKNGTFNIDTITMYVLSIMQHENFTNAQYMDFMSQLHGIVTKQAELTFNKLTPEGQQNYIKATATKQAKEQARVGKVAEKAAKKAQDAIINAPAKEAKKAEMAAKRAAKKAEKAAAAVVAK